jgi:hypothetical protein
MERSQKRCLSLHFILTRYVTLDRTKVILVYHKNVKEAIVKWKKVKKLQKNIT